VFSDRLNDRFGVVFGVVFGVGESFGVGDFRFERFGPMMGLVVGWISGCG
jgi:hypothetical protein